jgi:demethylmenaquinone methyltransferase/2-methoxy-6-polyprenyl-1,4-benzoquinol methylase
MLRLGLEKVRRTGLDGRVRFVRGDATCLPLPDASFDAATIGFGIRNVLDPEAGCRDVARVLRPGGQLAILEFGEPWIPGVRSLYRAYFRHVLPRVGRAVSKHGEAYDYLPASVANFPRPDAFADVIRRAGFAQVQYELLATGIVCLYLARK